MYHNVFPFDFGKIVEIYKTSNYKQIKSRITSHWLGHILKIPLGIIETGFLLTNIFQISLHLFAKKAKEEVFISVAGPSIIVV